jgi:hypothetical protein
MARFFSLVEKGFPRIFLVFLCMVILLVILVIAALVYGVAPFVYGSSSIEKIQHGIRASLECLK